MPHAGLLVILVLLLVGLILELFWFISTLQSIAGGAPFIALKTQRAHQAWELANLKPGEMVYELGCGDARHLIYACQHYGVKGVGVDISWWPLFLAWIRVRLSRLDRRVNLIWRNIHNIDISSANVVYLYLGQKLSDSLRDKFLKELKVGSRVVSVQFPLSGWHPVQVVGDAKHPIYLYRIG